MMASNQCLCVIILLLLVGYASSSSISDAVFESHGSSGRSLLQAKKSCPEDMESKNYTIITSRCKGPQYPATSCCQAFKEFACPFADAINDLTTDCSTTMFSYINLYGKYPPGLFAHECREGKEGLNCDSVAAANNGTQTSDGWRAGKKSLMVMLLGVFFLPLLHLF